MSEVGWKIREVDGNPQKEGTYFVVLTYETTYENVRTHERFKTLTKHAYITTRQFIDLDKHKGLESWVMDGEPTTGMAWTEETGSFEGEHVYAWYDHEEELFKDYPRPDGAYIWDDFLG